MSGGAAKLFAEVPAIAFCQFTGKLRPDGIEGMRRLPKGGRNPEGIYSVCPPPGAFVAAPMQLAMVQPANRNRELVADLAPHRPLLREFEVVGI